jgi:hypothetical protein
VEEPVQWHTESEPPPPPPRQLRPEPRPVDPLAGLAAELSRQPIPQPELPALRPRPLREREVARLRELHPERMRPAPQPAPAPAADESAAASADQNLADMAQRLEAALRRPKAAEARAAEPAAQPAPASEPDTMQEAQPAPAPAAAEPAAARDVPPPPRLAPKTPPAPAPQKSVYDSLEQEMASLLGRPKT